MILELIDKCKKLSQENNMYELSSLCNLMKIKITKDIKEMNKSYKISTENMLSNKINLITNSTLWDIIGNKELSFMYLKTLQNSSVLEICKISLKVNQYLKLVLL
jgi:hypothetical protein